MTQESETLGKTEAECASGNDLIENIKRYGNPKANYQPFDGAISYPLHSQDFVRTGFMEISPTLSARDYKDPKNVCEVQKLGYIEKGTGEHQSNSVYSEDGISPGLNASDSKEPVKVVQCQKIWERK